MVRTRRYARSILELACLAALLAGVPRCTSADRTGEAKAAESVTEANLLEVVQKQARRIDEMQMVLGRLERRLAALEGRAGRPGSGSGDTGHLEQRLNGLEGRLSNGLSLVEMRIANLEAQVNR